MRGPFRPRQVCGGLAVRGGARGEPTTKPALVSLGRSPHIQEMKQREPETSHFRKTPCEAKGAEKSFLDAALLCRRWGGSDGSGL